MSISKKTIIASKTIRGVSASGLQTSSKGAIGLSLGFEEIQKLISLMGKEPIDELQLEVGEVRLHIRKATGNAIAPATTNIVTQPNFTSIAQHQAHDDQYFSEQTDDLNLHYITSPIVGTFYRAPSINVPAFVQTGDSVKLGQTLCIVEAMKLMNEIECDIAGELVEIMVEDGQPVEYGERLFAVRVS